MNIIGIALRRPVSVCIITFAIALGALHGIHKMPRDILPTLDVPVIYVAQPYGGLDPGQMESYITYFYEYHFLYISGLEHVESKNIQSTAIIKLQFHPGTDMAQAMAETIAEVNRSRATMPAGTVPPFVIRFDEGSEPVGKLVFSSTTRSLGEMQNYALNTVRPLFATLDGVSAPPPFGSSARSIVIEVDPKKLAARDLSADQVANAIAQANTVVPSGNIHVGTTYPIIPMNSIVKNINELLDVPIRLGHNPTVLLGDIAKVVDGTDIPTGYALVNGKRTVYIPVTKRADASTLAVVDLVKQNIPRFQAVVPEDIKVSYEFDQSGYVRRAIGSLVLESILGAIFTGLMVLLFLRDLRSAVIVIVSIPLALLSAALALSICKETINIMTLGGLALAVGILVDETTVTIENIHAHLAKGSTVARAALEGTLEIFRPLLLTLLCILSVFIPSFFMEGVAHSLFVPLTLAVGFSMLGSFLLSVTLVPVLSVWLLKAHPKQNAHGFFKRFQFYYEKFLQDGMKHRKVMIIGYLISTVLIIIFLGIHVGREIFPQVDTGQLQLRLKAPTGTSIENTEKITLDILDLINKQGAPGGNAVEESVGFVGTQPPSYPINAVHLWTSGPHEAVLELALRHDPLRQINKTRERLRRLIHEKYPNVEISFEPSNLVDRTMSMGASTPIEIAINGSSLTTDREFAEKIRKEIQKQPFLRDIQYGQRFDFPAIQVVVNRKEAGYRGLTIAQIGQALIPATSSSRYLLQNYWRDPQNGINYQVQVEVPENAMTSIHDLENIPILGQNGDAVSLRSFAKLSETTKIGEYDRYNMQRMVTLTANLEGLDLGHATETIQKSIAPILKEKPRGVELHLRGQIAALTEMMRGLGTGLIIATGVVFLLLAANYESIRLSLAALSTLPAVLAGFLVMLFLTQTTLNIESFMGAIMAIGVAMANSILLVTFAERRRLEHSQAATAAIEGAISRLRPILMTSASMLVGMMPMAFGLGEGGQQTAPLGRAVIGGLLGSTIATLTILPMVFAWIQKKSSVFAASVHPDDPRSSRFEGEHA